MNEQAIYKEIIAKSGMIAREISRGKDVEIKTSNGGLKIYAVDKKIIK